MKTPAPRLTGAILAGGRSTRMGRDKAELMLTLPSGERLTMLELVNRTLESVCDETLVVGGPARAGVDARRVPDRFRAPVRSLEYSRRFWRRAANVCSSWRATCRLSTVGRSKGWRN